MCQLETTPSLAEMRPWLGDQLNYAIKTTRHSALPLLMRS